MNNPQPLTFAPDWSRGFLQDHAHKFVAVQLENGIKTPGISDNQLLERCTAYLMQVCQCSRRTAETQAAQTIAEMACSRNHVSFDMDRSTAHALFVVDRNTNTTRVISAAELVTILTAHEAAMTTANAPKH